MDLISLRYALPVLLAIGVAVAWPVSRHITSAEEKQRYWTLQGLTLIGAVIGAKLVVLTGDRFWPAVPLHQWSDIFLEGRSIVGGLIFGFLTAEAAKPLLGYKLPPNDRFAAVIPFSVAIGRIGCHLQGCCLGLPHDGTLSVIDRNGVARYPAPLIEVAFQLAIGVLFIAIVRRRMLHGRVFAVYLMAYGVFRFLTEFIRDTPRTQYGLSVYQFWCVLMIALGAISYGLRRRSTAEERIDGNLGTAEA